MGDAIKATMRMAASETSDANIEIGKLIIQNEEFITVGEMGEPGFVVNDKVQLDALIAGLQFMRVHLGWD